MTIARSVASAVAKPIAKPLTVSSSAASAALDIRARVGTSTSPTATGTKDIALPFEAKLFCPFGTLLSAAGTGTGLNLGFGGLTSAAQGAIAASSLNGLTTSNTDRRHDNADAVSIITDGTVTEEASRSAIAADKVTLNWTTAAATAFIYNHFAIGGADLECAWSLHQMNGTSAAESFAHGLSGAPTGVLFLSAAITSLSSLTLGELLCSIGAWAGMSQFGSSFLSAHNRTTTLTNRVLVTNAVLPFVFGGVFRSMAVSTVDATNVNVTYPVTGSQQYAFFMLAFRGAKCQVGTFNTASSNTIVTTGLTPKLFIPVFIPSGVASAGSVLNDLCLSIGASDGTNNVSCGITDANGLTTTNARRFQSSTTLCEYNTAGAKSFESTAAFSGESIVVTPTTALTNFGQAGYIAIGS